MKNAKKWLWFSLLLLLVIGCTTNTPDTEVTAVPLPTPTTFAFFVKGEDNTVHVTTQKVDAPQVPTVASLFDKRDTPTPKPSPTPPPTYPPSQSNITFTETFTVTLFDDALNHNWNIQEETGATVDMSSDIRFHNGQKAIAFTPQEDFSTLYFTLKPEADTTFAFDQMLGISLWLNGGDDYIQLDQLAIAVIGSNDHSYWVAGDDSVDFPSGESFSETRLYFLNLNRSITPETWVEVYLPLDMLIYDPEYNFIVGFYLKNDAGFNNTIYIDDVSFIMLPEARESASATPVKALLTPTPTATLTAIPTATPTASPAATPTKTATPKSIPCIISPPAGWKLYTIQAGETISGLSVNRGVSIDFVLSINCLDIDDIVSVGQQIWLPNSTIP